MVPRARVGRESAVRGILREARGKGKSRSGEGIGQIRYADRMLVIWGKTLRRKSLGEKPCFCVVCREYVSGAARAVKLHPHLYFIPMGTGTPIAEELECESCRTVYGFAPGHFAGPEARDFGEGVEPDEWRLYVERRYVLESLSRQGAIDAEERALLLAEPFELLEYLYKQKSVRGGQVSLTAVLCLFIIIAAFASAILWHTYFDPAARNRGAVLLWAWASTAVTAVLILTVLGRGVSNSRTAARKYVLAQLLRSLAPLRPTVGELTATLHEMRGRGNGLAAALRETDFVDLWKDDALTRRS